MRVLILAVATLAPSLAAAEPDTVERELRVLALPSDDAVDHGFKANAFAQLTGGASTDNAEGALSAGGQLHYAGRRCDYIRAGGQARLAWRDAAATPSAEQWASFCVPISILEVEHQLEWDVHPSLLSPLGLRPGANRRETIRFRWQPLRGPLASILDAAVSAEAQKEGVAPPPPRTPAQAANMPHGDLVIFDIQVEASFLWSRGGSLSARQTAEAQPFRYIRERVAPWGEHRDYVVDVGAGGGDFVDKGASVHVWLVKIENLLLGPLYTTGGIGIASADVGPFVSPVERQVQATAPRAVLAIETGGERVHGELRGTNDVTVEPDGYLALDTRLASTLTSIIGQTRIAATAAVARTEVGVPDAMPAARAHVTGGAAVSAVHRFSPHLEATIQLDVARSFYASQLAQQDFQPRWGVNAFAALQAVVGR